MEFWRVHRLSSGWAYNFSSFVATQEFVARPILRATPEKGPGGLLLVHYNNFLMSIGGLSDEGRRSFNHILIVRQDFASAEKLNTACLLPLGATTREGIHPLLR